MFSRRQSRIAAMQMLYQIQLTETPVKTVIDTFCENQGTQQNLVPLPHNSLKAPLHILKQLIRYFKKALKTGNSIGCLL